MNSRLQEGKDRRMNSRLQERKDRRMNSRLQERKDRRMNSLLQERKARLRGLEGNALAGADGEAGSDAAEGVGGDDFFGGEEAGEHGVEGGDGLVLSWGGWSISLE